MFDKTLTVTIDIAAPITLVWQIMTDFANYAEWNSFTPYVSCESRVGTPVTLKAHLKAGDAGRTSYLVLNKFEPPHQLCWGMSHWYLQANRCQTLTAVDENHTRYQNSEHFSGLLNPLVMLTQHDNLIDGFTRAATGLKQASEKAVSRKL
jgi:hypothetical protein